MSLNALKTCRPFSLWDVIENLGLYLGTQKPFWNYLEIGFGVGESCRRAAKAGASDIEVVDAFTKTYGGVYTEAEGRAAFDALMDELGYNPTTAHLYVGRSVEVLPQLCQHENQVDLCLVDGDHSVEVAMMDLYWAKQMVQPGGFLIFDDIRHASHLYLEQVWDLWAAANSKHFDCLKTEGDHPVGIAWKKLPKETP